MKIGEWVAVSDDGLTGSKEMNNMEHQEHTKQASDELNKLIDIIAYITRKDNPFLLYECSPLEEILNQGHSITESKILAESQDEIITSEELVQILSQLIALQKSGTRVESKRIPLLSSEYKFKGYRQVEFTYKDSNRLHVIMITNKRKEIHFKQIIEKEAGK